VEVKLRAPLLEVDALLRGEGRHAVGGGRLPVARLLLVLVACGALYGAVMGSFGGNALQALYSALKVPLLVLVASAVCLPNFYVVNLVLGLGPDFAAAFRGLLSAQATLAIALASLAPVTACLYLSTDSYALAKLFNFAIFAVATLAAQRTLARHYRPLLARDRRHAVALMAWPALYFFVAGQLAYVLRPFIGNPDLPTVLVRDHWWGNVYVDLLWAVRGL
jgi:hypothetical protein